VKRLVTRLTLGMLALGMLALALVTTIIIIFVTQLSLFLHFQSLPIDVRQALQSQFDTPKRVPFKRRLGACGAF